MGLFSKLFGGRTIEDDLLVWGSGLADETERVYRAHVSPLAPSGVGLLRARLMASAFTFCAFSLVATTPEQQEKLLIEACRVAAYALVKPGASPLLPVPEIQRISRPFINQVVQKILAEVQASRSGGEVSASFRELQAFYRSCLRDTIGDERKTSGGGFCFEDISEQVIAHSFKCMWQKIAALKSR